MEVFISWSGDRSGKVAEALRDWLPNVIQSVTPFMSASDIEKGSRWPGDLARHLEESQFGLVCLTPENLGAPWLLFEAGALSKSMDNSRVVPYLYGVSQTLLQGPLAQFQAASATKTSTLDVIKSINEASGENRLEPTRVEQAFETWWPQLEDTFTNIPETSEEAPPSEEGPQSRTDRDILEEILRLARQMSRQNAPNSEFDQRVLRNFVAHGLHSEPIDSPEDFNVENRRIPTDSARGENVLQRIRRDETRQVLEIRRRELEEMLAAHRSFENENERQLRDESDIES